MDSLLQQLIAIAQPQDFPHKGEFLEAAEAGHCAVRKFEHLADGTSLLPIYKVRHTLLSREGSAHAQSLTNDVAWLCSKLEAVQPERVSIWEAQINQPYKLHFFLEARSNEVLGCTKTVSRFDVTPEEWQRLWSSS